MIQITKEEYQDFQDMKGRYNLLIEMIVVKNLTGEFHEYMNELIAGIKQ